MLIPYRPAYYVAYGPHGPRTPLMTPGNGMRVFLGTGAAVAAAIGAFLYVRTRGEDGRNEGA